jgi:murein L,D-transpeptidase YafK
MVKGNPEKKGFKNIMVKIDGPEKMPLFYKFLVISNVVLLFTVVVLLVHIISFEKKILKQLAQKPQVQAQQEQKPRENIVIDRLLILKKERLMTAYSKGVVYREYKVALGKNPAGKKEVEWDYKTPEGIYKIDYKNLHSQFHKSLHISYPNAEDTANAEKLGKKPGGGIMLHGMPNDMKVDIKLHWLTNWTWGCIAVTNAEIDELYDLVPVGAGIEIRE